MEHTDRPVQWYRRPLLKTGNSISFRSSICCPSISSDYCQHYPTLKLSDKFKELGSNCLSCTTLRNNVTNELVASFSLRSIVFFSSEFLSWDSCQGFSDFVSIQIETPKISFVFSFHLQQYPLLALSSWPEDFTWGHKKFICLLANVLQESIYD